VITVAVRLPIAVGRVLKVTVNWVTVAAVTVPTAPLLKVTVLLFAMVSNPFPIIIKLPVAFIAIFVVLSVTMGVTEMDWVAEVKPVESKVRV
jgi:hypothetical protein